MSLSLAPKHAQAGTLFIASLYDLMSTVGLSCVVSMETGRTGGTWRSLHQEALNEDRVFLRGKWKWLCFKVDFFSPESKISKRMRYISDELNVGCWIVTSNFGDEGK